MKKITCICIGVLTILVLMLPISAFADGAANVPDVNAGEPFTWAYLATIAGAAAFTLIFVQFFKVPMDKVWKIPTRVFAYIVALVTMLVATAFTTGLGIQTALLAAVNAIIAALTAYGAYEVTFAKISRKNTIPPDIGGME